MAPEDTARTRVNTQTLRTLWLHIQKNNKNKNWYNGGVHLYTRWRDGLHLDKRAELHMTVGVENYALIIHFIQSAMYENTVLPVLIAMYIYSFYYFFYYFSESPNFQYLDKVTTFNI